MKLRRRHKIAKSENDREYLIENNTEHDHSKVLLREILFCFFFSSFFMYLDTSIGMEICKGYMEIIENWF